MLITVLDLEREPVVFENLALEPGAIDYGEEVTQVSPLAVTGRADVIPEHRGHREVVEDIRLQAEWSGDFEVACARCLEPVRSGLQGRFDLLFRPLGIDAGPPERSITADEAEIGYYQESGLLLEDVLREQVLLSLPPRTLCREDCKGLCPRCGCNLNSETCACDPAPADPRWSALSDLASRLKE
ncbi:MAG: YceD family protein [Acidobacteriaceae bacterium]